MISKREKKLNWKFELIIPNDIINIVYNNHISFIMSGEKKNYNWGENFKKYLIY